MRKNLLLIFLFSLSHTVLCQNLEGIWMSYTNKVIDPEKVYSINTGGIIIDFDRNELRQILSDSSYHFTIYENKKVLEIDLKEKKRKIKLINKNSIGIEIANNTLSIFHPLNLNYPIKSSQYKIENMVIGDCWRILNDSTKIKFLRDIHPISDANGNIKMVETIWEQSRPFVGNWFVSEVEKNFFLFLTIEDTAERNIYQIVSIENNKIDLVPLLEDTYKIEEIKICK